MTTDESQLRVTVEIGWAPLPSTGALGSVKAGSASGTRVSETRGLFPDEQESEALPTVAGLGGESAGQPHLNA
jgi:hypothetical protein